MTTTSHDDVKRIDLKAALGVDAVRKLVEMIGDRDDATISVQDTEGYILWATAAGAAAMFDREYQEFAGVHSTDFVHPEHVPSWLSALERVYDGHTVHWPGLVSSGSGDWVSISLNMWQVTAPDGRDLVVLLTVPGEG